MPGCGAGSLERNPRAYLAICRGHATKSKKVLARAASEPTSATEIRICVMAYKRRSSGDARIDRSQHQLACSRRRTFGARPLGQVDFSLWVGLSGGCDHKQIPKVVLAACRVRACSQAQVTCTARYCFRPNDVWPWKAPSFCCYINCFYTAADG